MIWLFQVIMSLFAVGAVLFFFWALWAPMETLGWWAGWTGKDSGPGMVDGETRSVKIEGQSLSSQRPENSRANFIVYLTAIGGISTRELSSRERFFLQSLEAQVPDSVIVHDVFPFSVNNNPLDGERVFAGLWWHLHLRRMRKRKSTLSMLIFLRNMLQVAVSADPRYGPMFSTGVAEQISHSLLRHGYPSEGNPRISMIAWSGGAQIAVGTAKYLHQVFQAPVQVFSLGGVMANNPGLAYVDHLYHLIGSRDRLFPAIGKILSPGRWPLLYNSWWNQARRQGRISIIVPGPMRHTGREDYYDGLTRLPNGRTYMDMTIDVIADRIVNAGRSFTTHIPASK